MSDYTRYLPAATSGRRLFWAIFAGNVLATFFTCAVGAYLIALPAGRLRVATDWIDGRLSRPPMVQFGLVPEPRLKP